MQNTSQDSRPLGESSVLSDFSSSRSIWPSFFTLVLAVLAFRVFYNLYFHPLAKFRGPRLAALSTLWLYFNSRDGKIEQKLELLHQKYQTNALRISPSKLHITESKLYHEIYAQNTAFMKDPSFYAAFVSRHNLFTEVDKDLHRQRKKALSPAFSKSNISSMQPLLASKIDVFCQKLSQLEDRGHVNIHNAFRCMTVDIITELAFGKCFDLLHKAKDAKFDAQFLQAFDQVADSTDLFYHFPALRWLLAIALPNVLGRLGLAVGGMTIFLQTIKQAMHEFQSTHSSRNVATGEVIFERLIDLSTRDLEEEARDILVAGSDTTATTLSNAVYHICSKQAVKKKLTAALDEFENSHDGKMDLSSLEKIPYLSACVKESIRIAMPVTGGLPRVVPEPQPGKPAFMVDGHVVPPKTIVSVSAYSVHYDEAIWGSDARSFVPERWLKPEAMELERYLVTFSKGTRMCIGMNLAYAEVTMTLAKLFLSFDIQVDPSCTAATIEGLDRFTKAYPKEGICVSIANRAGDRPTMKLV